MRSKCLIELTMICQPIQFPQHYREAFNYALMPVGRSYVMDDTWIVGSTALGASLGS